MYKKICFVLSLLIILIFLTGCGGGGGSGGGSGIPERPGSSFETCNGYDDNGDGIVDEGDVCEINVHVCKTNNFDENSEECVDGEWASDSTEEGKLSVNYHTKEEDIGRNEFYTYICDAYFEDGDYGCYYFVKGGFSVGDVVCNDDGIRDGNEECDGDDLDGKGCEDYGFSGGGLGCNSCMFDFSDCVEAEEEINNITMGGVAGQPLEFDGYIVELSEVPLLSKKNQLENEINQKRIDASSINTNGLRILYNGPIKIFKNWRADSFQNNFAKNLGKQGKKINEEQKKTIEDIEKLFLDSKSQDIESHFHNSINGILVNVSSEEIKQIKDLPNVKDVYPNYRVETYLMNSVPRIGGGIGWQLGYTGKGITIAIIDTGIDYTHPDLGGCFGIGCKVEGGYDLFWKDSDPRDGTFTGHGTHIAGIVAANGKVKGVAPDATLYAYKIGSEFMGMFIAFIDDIIQGIDMAVDPNEDGDFSDKVDSMILSLGVNCHLYGGYSLDCGPDDALSQAVDRAVADGVVVVVAAGNLGSKPKTIASPGTARNAITVGSTGYSDFSGNYIPDYSSRGPVDFPSIINKPDIVAPGEYICSTRTILDDYDISRDKYLDLCLDSDHVLWSGTSMSAPHVAGAAALLLEADHSLKPQEIKNILKSSATDLMYDQNTQGAGMLDIEAALAKMGKSIDPIEGFVFRFYLYVLGRNPDKIGLESWVNGLKSGTVTGDQVAKGFINSKEFKNKKLPDQRYIQILYKALFNRRPDAVGFNGWMEAMDKGMSREEVLKRFLGSQEFLELCDSFKITCNGAGGVPSPPSENPPTPPPEEPPVAPPENDR